MSDRLPLFPPGTHVNRHGHLVVGGCDTVQVAAEFGTPLYLFDEDLLRAKCREFQTEFGQRYENVRVLYACKAYVNAVIARLMNEEGMGLDVVSGGELGIAHAARFPMGKVYLHGNNKSRAELELALRWKVGRIVVDNLQELAMLAGMVKERGVQQDILLRINPGVDPQTHAYTATGAVDSKFGVPQAHTVRAVKAAMSAGGLNLLGLHFHIGSRIRETGPYAESVRFALGVAAEMKDKYGLETRELNVGGGYDVRYTLNEPWLPTAAYAEAITATIRQECRRLKLELPRLVVEPGREIVAQAGVALYTVGVTKDIPGVRAYVSVDGGMADNIRPALYQARLEAVTANRMRATLAGKVTIAGKFCESGDVLIHDIEMPALQPGDILAVPGAGAYSLPESMNYNAFLRPPVVMVKDGQARLIRRRETLRDITRCDVKTNNQETTVKTPDATMAAVDTLLNRRIEHRTAD